MFTCWPDEQMSRGHYDQMIWGHGDQMTRWYEGIMTWWCHDAMMPWCHDDMTTWRHDDMTAWWWRDDVMTWWRDDVMTSLQGFMIITHCLHFKSISNSKLCPLAHSLTHLLTRVKSRDASASKNRWCHNMFHVKSLDAGVRCVSDNCQLSIGKPDWRYMRRQCPVSRVHQHLCKGSIK